jgi:hypothetical protein
MSSPDVRRGSVPYYIAFALLLVALGVAAGLIGRAVRQTSVRAEITVADPEPVDCPTGERAPACFQFEVRNLGPEAAQVECRIQPADQALAEFLPGGDTFAYSPGLEPGLSFSVIAKVQPGVDETVRAPSVRCEPS